MLSKKDAGFTIVELLIVIIIIGILAAIVIIAYQGVNARAKTSQAQATASAAVKKTEAFNAEKSAYPVISTDLTGASASGTSYFLTGVSFVAAMGTTPPASAASLTFYKCGTGASVSAPTSVATITTTTGSKIEYFNFTTSSTSSISAGITSGSVGGYATACFVNN